MGYMTNGLSFRTLREANKKRLSAPAYRKAEAWITAQWMQALVGEVGELANILKKIDRGDFDPVTAQDSVANELADIQCYLDLLAHKLGVDLGEATKLKFNEVSDRINSPVYIGDDDDWHYSNLHSKPPFSTEGESK